MNLKKMTVLSLLIIGALNALADIQLSLRAMALRDSLVIRFAGRPARSRRGSADTAAWTT